MPLNKETELNQSDRKIIQNIGYLEYLVIYGLILNLINHCRLLKAKYSLSYLPTPPLGQDMTQGQFF